MRALFIWAVPILVVGGLPGQIPRKGPAVPRRDLPRSGGLVERIDDQTQAALDSLLQVGSVHIESTSRGTMVPIDVEVRNTSDKTITAVAVSLAVHYAGNTDATSEVIVDLIKPVVAPELSPDAALRSGLSYHAKSFVRADEGGLPPTLVIGKPSAVMFEDRTAIGKSTPMRLILDRRAEEARYLAAFLDELTTLDRTAQQDSSGPKAKDPSVSLESALRERLDKSRHEHHVGVEQRRTSDLERYSGLLRAGRPYFQAEITKYRKLQKGLAEHAGLKEER